MGFHSLLDASSGRPDRLPNGLENQSSLSDTVLRLIWSEGNISRAEIARVLNLSRSTVTEIVRDILASRFVSEGGRGESSGGRRPIVLEFEYNAGIMMGVDIGATHVSVLLVNLKGERLAFREERFGVRADPTGTIRLAIHLAEECLKESARSEVELLAMGVAMPSPIDPLTPEQLPETVMPHWKGSDVLSLFRSRFEIPVYIDNDTNLGALAEFWWGAGSLYSNVVFIKAGYGIGAGFILDGRVYRGDSGFAGEIGHIPLDADGPDCVCGLKGCLVTLVGGLALEERARALHPCHPDSLLDPAKISYRAILQASRDGDPMCKAIVQQAAIRLGQALSGVINLLNPGLIVIGGGWSVAGEELISMISEEVGHCVLIQKASPPRIQLSELGPRVIALGAATLALEKSLLTPDFYQIESF